jgi:hypothetical protein
MTDYLAALSSFGAAERHAALQHLSTHASFPPERDWVNMHIHSFFSYSGEGWSPSRVAYEMKKLGLYAAAVCDFDVLQALDEFLAAAEVLRLRAAVGFESRVFFRDYASQEINSPGEPGVFYFMGMGFVRQPAAGTKAAAAFADMLQQSHARNRAVIERINCKLGSWQLDYEKDVLPLTPNDNATERHIIAAFNQKAIEQLGSAEAAASFWADLFDAEPQELAGKLKDSNAFNEYLRSKLMKRGGVGYEQPTEASFPALENVIAMIKECRAIPMSAWLDGSSEGESNPEEQLECLAGKGVAAVNIIPDRNWNFKDAAVKAEKIAALTRYVEAAQDLNMPINVGTEGNKPGQRLVDDFASEALQPFHQVFLEGAQVMVGHTRLLRYADFSYVDADAQGLFACQACRNRLFASVGALPAPDLATRDKLDAMGASRAFAYLQDCAGAGRWR